MDAGWVKERGDLGKPKTKNERLVLSKNHWRKGTRRMSVVDVDVDVDE